MLATFDPDRSRRLWLTYRLAYLDGCDYAAIPPAAQVHFAQIQASRVVDAFLAGLAEEVSPQLDRLVRWMERQPEPDRDLFSGEGFDDDAHGLALWGWRQALGLCRWLLSGEPDDPTLVAALTADWAGLFSREMPTRRTWAGRLETLSQRMATALAADVPRFGLRFYKAISPMPPYGANFSVHDYATWAGLYLDDGNGRDETFVEKGHEMLNEALLGKFFWEGTRIEPALWLKAIYFDSGIVDTPAQAIARAYDSMPGVTRPDFLPADNGWRPARPLM